MPRTNNHTTTFTSIRSYTGPPFIQRYILLVRVIQRNRNVNNVRVIDHIVQMDDGGNIVSVIVSISDVTCSFFVQVSNPFITSLPARTSTTVRSTLSIARLMTAVVVGAGIVVVTTSAAAGITGGLTGAVTA